MPEFNYAALGIGDFPVAPTVEQLDVIGRYDTAHGSAGREGHALRPASFDIVPVALQAQVLAAGVGQPVDFVAPWPMTLAALSAGWEVSGAGLTAVNVDVLVEPEAGGGFVSVLDAPENIFIAGPGGSSPLFAPEDGLQVINFGDKVRVTFSPVGGTIDGAVARLFTKRA